MENLLKNENIQNLNENLKDSIFLEEYEDKLVRNRLRFNDIELNNLLVLSLLYSNIATIHLQFLIHSKDSDYNIRRHKDYCETYHINSQYLRSLLVRINRAMYGIESNKYKDSVYYLSNFFHSLATQYYYQRNYTSCIAIRSVLYLYYLNELKSNEKAIKQFSLTPFSIFDEKDNPNLFEYLSPPILEDLELLVNKPWLSYKEYRETYKNFQILFEN